LVFTRFAGCAVKLKFVAVSTSFALDWGNFIAAVKTGGTSSTMDSARRGSVVAIGTGSAVRKR